MKTSKLNTLFLESAERGKNEEVGSIDTFLFRGQTFFVNKTDENTFVLSDDKCFLPIAEHIIN